MMYNDDDHAPPTGDPRRCKAHPWVVTSSPDGMFDAPCGECEGATWAADAYADADADRAQGRRAVGFGYAGRHEHAQRALYRAAQVASGLDPAEFRARVDMAAAERGAPTTAAGWVRLADEVAALTSSGLYYVEPW